MEERGWGPETRSVRELPMRSFRHDHYTHGEPDKVQSMQSIETWSECNNYIRVLMTITDPQLSESGIYIHMQSTRYQWVSSPSPPSLHTGMHSSTDTWPFPVPDVSSMQTLQIVLGTVLPIAVILVFVVVTVMICTANIQVWSWIRLSITHSASYADTQCCLPSTY